MQKFLRILIIISLFIACVLIGAQFAKATLEQNPAFSGNNPPSQKEQLKLLVFVTDDLTKEKSELISLWAVNIYYQDSAGVMMIPITTVNQENYDRFSRSFYLTEDKTLHKRSLNYFQTNFKTRWDAVLVVDHLMVDELVRWISIGKVDSVSLETNYENEQVSEICSVISGSTPQDLNNFNWDYYQNHFTSSIPLEQINLSWSNMVQKDPRFCEIIRN